MCLRRKIFFGGSKREFGGSILEIDMKCFTCTNIFKILGICFYWDFVKFKLVSLALTQKFKMGKRRKFTLNTH